MSNLIISALDQSPIRDGDSAVTAIQETVELAKLCDQLGYHRYWLAEHHSSSSFAGTAPEILIAYLAAATQNIRIGSGGVMISHYSPLKIAEQFRLLEALAPGRIDLGIGRAPGSDPKTSAALQSGPQAWPGEVFPQQLEMIRQFLAMITPISASTRSLAAIVHPIFGCSAQAVTAPYMPHNLAYPMCMRILLVVRMACGRWMFTVVTSALPHIVKNQ